MDAFGSCVSKNSACTSCSRTEKRLCFPSFPASAFPFSAWINQLSALLPLFFCAIICLNMFKKWVLELILRYE